MASSRSMTKIARFRSGSISQRHGSADPNPDPHQNVMDPQQWILSQDPRHCASEDGHLSVPRSASSLTSESERGIAEVSRQVHIFLLSNFAYNTCIIIPRVTGGIFGFFLLYVWYSTLLHLPPPQIPLCRWMLGSNPVPEFIDPRFRENKPKTLVFSHWIRAFWACFRENWVYNFGHW